MPELGAPRVLDWVAQPGPNGDGATWPVNCAGHEALCDGAAHAARVAPGAALVTQTLPLRRVSTCCSRALTRAARTPAPPVLRRVAVNREVMVAVANSQAPGLQAFLDSIAALTIPNFMARALPCALRVRLATSLHARRAEHAPMPRRGAGGGDRPTAGGATEPDGALSLLVCCLRCCVQG